jgi:hypothetical protein
MPLGPILIFDKSFLQSLNVDEAVWLDNFFLTVITPLFFVETLADLEKEVHRGRTPEQVGFPLVGPAEALGNRDHTFVAVSKQVAQGKRDFGGLILPAELTTFDLGASREGGSFDAGLLY